MPPEPSRLRRNYLPQDFQPILELHLFDGSIVAQAINAFAETHRLLSIASRHEFVRGVVGWVDLADPN